MSTANLDLRFDDFDEDDDASDDDDVEEEEDEEEEDDEDEDDEYAEEDEEPDEDEEVREAAIAEMKEWFLERFEDPAHRTPYESAEGGYIWIWGGPYDAGEELGSEFSGQHPEEWIREAVEELEQDCVDWAPVPSEEDYDSSLFTVIESNTKPLRTLKQALTIVEALLTEDVDAVCLTRCCDCYMRTASPFLRPTSPMPSSTLY